MLQFQLERAGLERQPHHTKVKLDEAMRAELSVSHVGRLKELQTAMLIIYSSIKLAHYSELYIVLTTYTSHK